jgi:hypothetical protein
MDLPIVVRRLPRNVTIQWDGEAYELERPSWVQQAPLEATYFTVISIAQNQEFSLAVEELEMMAAQLVAQWRSPERPDIESFMPDTLAQMWLAYQATVRLSEREKKVSQPSATWEKSPASGTVPSAPSESNGSDGAPLPVSDIDALTHHVSFR